jgi:hypothetical protein
MIKTVASLLAAFSEAEVREIEKAGIKHAPTIGSMYEGLTSTLLHKAIPEGLGLQVVSGFIDDGQGNLTDQIDCMLVKGTGISVPFTILFKWHIKDVIAVLEVKKNLFSSELADAHGDLRKVLKAYGNYVQEEATTRTVETDDRVVHIGSALHAFGQMTGLVPPKHADASSLPFDLEMLYRSLVIERLSPVRIVFGYGGFNSEFGLRKAFFRFLKKNIKVRGFGATSFPQLIIAGRNSIVKANGQPYLYPLINNHWALLLSSNTNPLNTLLELIWTRLSQNFDLPDWFDDSELEEMHTLLLARAIKQQDLAGWSYEACELSKTFLQEPSSPEQWRPMVVTLEQFILLNALCRESPLNLQNPGSQLLLEANNIDLDKCFPALNENRLVARRGDELFLLTNYCVCAITPSGEYVAGEDNGGRMAAWLGRQVAAARGQQT